VAVAVAEHPAAAPSGESALEDEVTSLLGEEDPLEALEVADAAVVARIGLGGQSADDAPELEPSPAEELELLEADDLDAVAQALRGRTRI
jgi:hypothetical protein